MKRRKKKIKALEFRHCDIHDRCIDLARAIHRELRTRKIAVLICGISGDGAIPAFKVANTLWKLRHKYAEVYYVTVRSYLLLPDEVRNFMGKVIFIDAIDNKGRTKTLIENDLQHSIDYRSLFKKRENIHIALPWHTSVDYMNMNVLSDIEIGDELPEMRSVKFDDRRDPKIKKNKNSKCPKL